MFGFVYYNGFSKNVNTVLTGKNNFEQILKRD